MKWFEQWETDGAQCISEFTWSWSHEKWKLILILKIRLINTNKNEKKKWQCSKQQLIFFLKRLRFSAHSDYGRDYSQSAIINISVT